MSALGLFLFIGIGCLAAYAEGLCSTFPIPVISCLVLYMPVSGILAEGHRAGAVAVGTLGLLSYACGVAHRRSAKRRRTRDESEFFNHLDDTHQRDGDTGCSEGCHIPSPRPLEGGDLGGVTCESTLTVPGGWIREQTAVVRQFSRGFSVKTKTRDHHFLYDDIDAYSFQLVSRVVNGAGAGLSCFLAVWPKAAASREPLTFQFWIPPISVKARGIFGLPSRASINPTHDETLEGINSDLAGTLAIRLHTKWQSEGSVRWVPGLSIDVKGLELQSGCDKPKRCEFQDIVSVQLGDGSCTVQSSSSELPECHIDMGAINFYPGLLLLRRLAATNGVSV
ncbi:MAG: hypothetical protein FJ276_25740 [Planctomycetes bacterium]|nr:hypothetical protein [Planctomycetota bacterium]